MDMLFFQVVILMVAIFAFQVLRLEDTFYFGSKKHSIIIGILAGLGIDLCMTFPVHMGHGFILDLRWIGFLVALLYGGIYGWGVCSVFIFRPHSATIEV